MAGKCSSGWQAGYASPTSTEGMAHMDDWLRTLADALGEEPLDRHQTGDVLRLSRDVAHATERRFAPLSTLLVGLHAGRLAAGGLDRQAAIQRALAAAEQVLVQTPSDPPTPRAP